MRALTFAALRDANVTRCEASYHPLDDWNATDWLAAVTGELGEAAGLIKHLRRGEAVSPEALGHELADTVINLDLLAARLGIDLGEAIRAKFNLVSERIESEVRL
jgi:NTP pyrophosphatase (non-canonical NTP hydrolase)